MPILRRILFIAVVTGGLGTFVSGAAAAPESIDPQAATPLTNAEIYKMYGQKSWIWKDGAGNFSVPKRQFSAFSGKRDTASYGVGRWFIIGPGKLCFRAVWHAKGGSAPATTCFSHRKDGRVIFQKREPDGKWYVFRNAPAKKGDEFAKLRRGDYVSARLSRIEAQLSASE